MSAEPTGDALRALFAPAMARYRAGLVSLTLIFRDSFTPAIIRARRSLDAFSRAMARRHRHRSGHRHRGTDAWRLRFVAPVRAPLGQRTAAKRRLVRMGPRERAAQRLFDRTALAIEAGTGRLGTARIRFSAESERR